MAGDIRLTIGYAKIQVNDYGKQIEKLFTIF